VAIWHVFRIRRIFRSLGISKVRCWRRSYHRSSQPLRRAQKGSFGPDAFPSSGSVKPDRDGRNQLGYFPPHPVGEDATYYELSDITTKYCVEFCWEGVRHSKIKGTDMLDAIDRLFAAKPRLAMLLVAGLMVALGLVMNVEEACAAGVVLALLVCASLAREALRARGDRTKSG
jgi:hypothetical protein